MTAEYWLVTAEYYLLELENPLLILDPKKKKNEPETMKKFRSCFYPLERREIVDSWGVAAGVVV